MSKESGEKDRSGIHILDVHRLYHERMHAWNIWIAPLMKDKMWYTTNWFNETMKAFENAEEAMKGISVVFMVMPPPKVIVSDHK